MHRDNQVALLAKKQMVVELLDRLCQQIEVTDTQYEEAKAKYETIGSWLAGSNSSELDQVQIYPQGSIALGTTVRPLATAEFDVDLVCHLPSIKSVSDAQSIKTLVGDRLKEHGTYKERLEEKQRCWRIHYANQFHLDITPSIPNSGCHRGGELVPDKVLKEWKPTNPKGYIAQFDYYAAMMPRFDLEKIFMEDTRAEITPMPEKKMSKPILKRIVQLLKRHRDNRFVNTDHSDLAPVSVIITTLAGWAYEKCVDQQVYTDGFDFITAVIREMPTFIRQEVYLGKLRYIIENETTIGENFADKWNDDPRRAEAFYKWHKDVLGSVETLLQIEGADQIAKSLSSNFGAQKEHVRAILTSIIDPIGEARSTGLLAVSPIVGVGLIPTPALGSVPVKHNKFYGA